MAKVVIELTHEFKTENNGLKTEMLGTNVSVAEISPHSETGPQDVLAYIFVSMAPEFIRQAGERLAQEMTANGAPAFSQVAKGVRN